MKSLRNVLFSSSLRVSLLSALALLTQPARADLVGPYSPDANTLYLFHFNEAAGSSVATNVGTKGGNVITVTNDASFDGLAGNLQQVTTLLGFSSYAGYGNALSGTNFDGANGAAAYDGNADGQYTSDQNNLPSN
jgi:hypothetical protein